MDIKTKVLLDAKIQNVSTFDAAELMEWMNHKGIND